MSKRVKSLLLRYGIGLGVCLAYAAYHCLSRDMGAMAPVDIYRTVSDAFTVPGLVCIFAGLLIWLSNEGAFHGISYVLKRAAQALIFLGRRGSAESYGEYLENHRKNPLKGYSFLFLVGVVCMVVAAVFMALYYQAYN